MAISATMSVDKTWATAGQHIHCLCTVLNTGGADVKVTSVSRAQLNSTASGTCDLPLPPNVTVPAGGTLVLPWVEVMAANVKLNATEFQFTMGATVYTDDGSVTVATPASVTIVPEQTVQGLQAGQYPNAPIIGQLRLEGASSALVAATLGLALTVPINIHKLPPQLPQPGQASLDNPYNGALVAVVSPPV